MKGNIYTEEKCQICGKSMKHIETRSGCFCPDHPEQAASKKFYVKFGRSIKKRFKMYVYAERFLNKMRYESDTGVFDEREYMAGQLMSFKKLAAGYLIYKGKQKLKSFYHIKCYINRAVEYFGHTNVKDIRGKEISDFLDTLDVSDKTRANYSSQIHDFYHDYLYGYLETLTLADLPKFPKIDYELGFRKLIGIPEREEILNQLKDDTYRANPKLVLAIDMLCSYNKLRPGDLRTIKEGDIDLTFGVMTIWRPTKRKQKKVPKVIREKLLPFHLEEIKRLKQEYPALAATPFFRHSGKTQAKKDTPFGINYIYKNWKKVCKKCGYDDLDLYGATRHSSTTAIAMMAGKKKARKFSGHDTNKAFDRYCQIADDDSQDMAELMAQMRGKIEPLPVKKQS